MQLEQGWIVGVTRVVSPHCDLRPNEEAPSLLVIHNISLPPGEFLRITPIFLIFINYAFRRTA